LPLTKEEKSFEVL
jgi:hypothetical protein